MKIKLTKCAICGKEVDTTFTSLKSWAYCKSGVFCCSYTCMSKLLDLSADELVKLRKKLAGQHRLIDINADDED